MENRNKNRHKYNKTILCFGCTNTGEYEVKLPFLVTVNNISFGGIGIEAKQFVPKGAIITFRLAEDEGSRKFDIEVRWVKYEDEIYHIGTKFINIVKEDVVFLFNMIKKIT